MYRIALCQENEADLAALREALEQFFRGRPDGFSCSEYGSFETLLGEAGPGFFDIAILDTSAGGQDGVAAAVKLRAADSRVVILFVTAHADRVFDSFDAEPLQYLLKPVAPETFVRVLTRALEKTDLSRKTSFSFTFEKRLYRLPVDDILYFETDRRIVRVVTSSETYRFYGKLGELEAKSALKSFIRCHYSYLVNPGYIRSVSCGELVLSTGETVKVSRSRARAVQRRFADFSAGLE